MSGVTADAPVMSIAARDAGPADGQRRKRAAWRGGRSTLSPRNSGKKSAQSVAASLCTDPADRPAAESAICRMDELAGHKVPQFIWCESPAAVRQVIRMLSPHAGGLQAGALGPPARLTREDRQGWFA